MSYSKTGKLTLTDYWAIAAPLAKAFIVLWLAISCAMLAAAAFFGADPFTASKAFEVLQAVALAHVAILGASIFVGLPFVVLLLYLKARRPWLAAAVAALALVWALPRVF